MDPYAEPPDGEETVWESRQELATVGGLLVNELVADSRGMVERPMTIIMPPPVLHVEPYRITDDGWATVEVRRG